MKVARHLVFNKLFSLRRRCFIPLIGVCVLCSPENLARSQDLADLIDELSSLAGLKAKITAIGNGGFAKDENFRAEIEWMENISGRYYRRLKVFRFGEIAFDVTNSFDGESYYSFDQTASESIVKIGKGVPEVVHTFALGFFPLDVYSFLLDHRQDSKADFPGLRRISKMTDGLSNTLEPSNFQGMTSVFRVLSGWPDSRTGRALKYKVFFSTESPPQFMGWESYFSDGNICARLSVSKWQIVQVRALDKKLSFPSQYHIQLFLPSPDTGESIPSFGYNVTVSIEAVSAVDVEEVAAIDPAGADLIFDRDAKVLIPNPK